MAKRLEKRLDALAVKRATTQGRYPDGQGLYLQVKPSGTKSWLFRYTLDSVRDRRNEHSMGLGPYPSVSLAEARDEAEVQRKLLLKGVDPLDARADALLELRRERASAKTFDECARAYVENKAPEWKNPKHAAQWTSTLNTYASPFIGKMPVHKIDMDDIVRLLEPIWLTKTETATRVRERVEGVLDYATARKYRTETRDGANPARWKGNLDKMLAIPGRVAKVVHHKALPWQQVGAFMQSLRAQQGMGARALEFAILTAARSGDVRGATWSEIDMDSALWTVPAARMKMDREHRVPLSEAALDLLRALPHDSALVFPAPMGGVMSDMTLSAVLKRMKVPAVPHGFRSTFRTWGGEATTHPRELLEMALAHKLESKVEEVYARTDLFERRRAVMSDWATICAKALVPGSVSPIRSAASA